MSHEGGVNPGALLSARLAAVATSPQPTLAHRQFSYAATRQPVSARTDGADASGGSGSGFLSTRAWEARGVRPRPPTHAADLIVRIITADPVEYTQYTIYGYSLASPICQPAVRVLKPSPVRSADDRTASPFAVGSRQRSRNATMDGARVAHALAPTHRRHTKHARSASDLVSRIFRILRHTRPLSHATDRSAPFIHHVPLLTTPAFHVHAALRAAAACFARFSNSLWRAGASFASFLFALLLPSM
jgi:hypothetical protein